jgi:hypothetical protein
MDSELFTVGGLAGMRDSTGHSRDLAKTADLNQVHYQTARTLQTYRHFGKVLYWALIIYVINMVITMWPKMIILWSSSIKSTFSQKEGLQYLGATTNVTRDDTGWPTSDSLAEIALRKQNATTVMPMDTNSVATKTTFVVPREHMHNAKSVLTPEEKLLQQQAAAAH